MRQEKEDKNSKYHKITIFFILIFFNFNIYAQHNFGITGGLNYSKLIGNELKVRQKLPLYLYNAGIFAEFKYGIRSTIQVEFKYDLKGGIFTDSVFYRGIYEITERLDYFTLPVLYKYKFENKKFDIFLFYGGSLSYLIQSSREYYAVENGVPVNVEFLFPYTTKDYSIDVFAGWGVRYNLMLLDLRYSWGFTGIWGRKNIPIVRNSVISLNFSYIFFKTRKKSYNNRR